MPLYLRDRDDILGWLEERAIDRRRTNSRILKKVLRLSDSSDLAAVLHSRGAAITDDDWFKGESEPDLTWREVRFRRTASRRSLSPAAMQNAGAFVRSHRCFVLSQR